MSISEISGVYIYNDYSEISRVYTMNIVRSVEYIQ